MQNTKRVQQHVAAQRPNRSPDRQGASEERARRLEIVVKSDGPGPLEAVCAELASLEVAGVSIRIFRRGVGDVNKTDVVNAETGSRLIVGFNVAVPPRVEEVCREHGVEVRLYRVIYHLTEEVRAIAASLQVPEEAGEEVTGAARVIALFKSSRHDLILGCQVVSGKLQVGASFHVISGMGPIYTGVIESLHIEQESVRQATPGQQVGLKVRNFKRAGIGDLVECFKKSLEKRVVPWVPTGKVLYR